jgi:SAM-dependent methyltransferase
MAEEEASSAVVGDINTNSAKQEKSTFAAIGSIRQNKRGFNYLTSCQCPEICHRLCTTPEIDRTGKSRPYEVRKGPYSFTPSIYIERSDPRHILSFRRPYANSPTSRYLAPPWIDKHSYSLPLRLLRSISSRWCNVKIPRGYWLDNYTLTKDEKASWMDRLNFSTNDELKTHFQKVRHQSWQQVQEFSIARWWFLSNRLNLSPYYSSLIANAREGTSIADLACGFGQDCRFLRSDGATGKIYAIDICPKNWELGLQLFNDSPGPAEFIQADLYDDSNRGGSTNPCGLHALHDKVDIFLLNDFVSFFSEELVDSTLHTIARASKKGSRIIGWAFGSEQTDPTNVFPDLGHGMIYNLDFFRDVGWGPFSKLERSSKAKWDLQTQLLEPEEFGFSVEELETIWPAWPLKILCFMAIRTT